MGKSFFRRNMLGGLMALFAVVFVTMLMLAATSGPVKAATANPSVASAGYGIIYAPVFGTWTTSATAKTNLGKIYVPWPIRVVACHVTAGTVTGSSADIDARLVYSNNTSAFNNMSGTGDMVTNSTAVNVTDETYIQPQITVTGTGTSLTNMYFEIIYKRR